MSLQKFDIPKSKSESHRALSLLYLSNISLDTLENPSKSRDTQIFIQNLTSNSTELDFFDAGTPARISLALFAFEGKKVTLKGNASLNSRPIKALVDVLNELGANIKYIENEGFFPCSIHGKLNSSLIPSDDAIVVDRSVSSQFVTALMLVSSQFNHLPKINIELVGTAHSQSYIHLTRNILEQFQIPCTYIEAENRIEIKPHTPVVPKKLRVESDWSSALYGIQQLLAKTWTNEANLRVFIPDLKFPSAQGDSQTLSIFKQLGLKFQAFDDGIIFSAEFLHLPDSEFQIDCRNFPDAVPSLVSTFAMAWWFKKNHLYSVIFEGIGNLRSKESDRIKALQITLKKFGFEFVELNDENFQLQKIAIFQIATSQNMEIKTFYDHRIAMCFSPWKRLFPNLEFDDYTCVEKSFPDFWNQINF
jgi:3-phosphoshikimate 1-carboxyvinyltransferase